MKAYLWSLLLPGVLVGCGKSELGVSTSVGTVRSYVAAPASSSQLATVTALCQKLKDKATNYQYYLNGYGHFNFVTSYSQCGGAAQSSNVVAQLSNASGRLTFNVTSGARFITQVETNDSGLVSTLCNAGTSLGYPQASSSNVAVWYTISQGNDCARNSNSTCVRLETGVKQSGGDYLITYSDAIALDFSPGQDYGKVTSHVREDITGCDLRKGLKSVTTSTFSGIN